jgi:hypothetical protein
MNATLLGTLAHAASSARRFNPPTSRLSSSAGSTDACRDESMVPLSRAERSLGQD